MRHRVLQRLGGDFSVLYREVALGVRDVQRNDRVRRFRSADQKVRHGGHAQHVPVQVSRLRGWNARRTTDNPKQFDPAPSRSTRKPQGQPLPEAWRDELGPEWPRVWQTWLHTLGNLTWTAFNSEMGNRPFVGRHDASREFRESPLRHN